MTETGDPVATTVEVQLGTSHDEHEHGRIATGTWHDMWSGVVYQAKDLIRRGKQTIR